MTNDKFDNVEMNTFIVTLFLCAVMVAIIWYLSSLQPSREDYCKARWAGFERVEYNSLSGCQVYYNGKMWPEDRIWLSDHIANVE